MTAHHVARRSAAGALRCSCFSEQMLDVSKSSPRLHVDLHRSRNSLGDL
jgi:hypothetical protein